VVEEVGEVGVARHADARVPSACASPVKTERLLHRHFPAALEFRVQGLGFRVQGLGFRVQGLGFRVQGLGFRVQGLGFRVYRMLTSSSFPYHT
jgi:hypothetical protein